MSFVHLIKAITKTYIQDTLYKKKGNTLLDWSCHRDPLVNVSSQPILNGHVPAAHSCPYSWGEICSKLINVVNSFKVILLWNCLLLITVIRLEI